MSVSVVIPTLGRPRFLNEVLPSYLRATGVDEVVIVDDGSPKPVEDTLAAEFRGDERVRVVRHRRTMGSCAARNTGTAAARGEYTLIGEDDVWLEQGYVENLVEFRSRLGPCIVVGPLIQQIGDETVAAATARVRGLPRPVFDVGKVEVETSHVTTPTQVPFGHAIMLTDTQLFTSIQFSTLLGAPTFMGEDREFQLAAFRHEGVPTWAIPGPVALHYDKSLTIGGGTRPGKDAWVRLASAAVCRWLVRSTYEEEIAAYFPGVEPAELRSRAVRTLLALELKRQVQARSPAARKVTKAWYKLRGD